MIKLYQFPPIWSLPNASPFCMKLETYLRMVQLPFEIVSVSNPGKSPKGKLPCINDEGHKISDSGFIIEYLQQKYGNPLDSYLSLEQKALSLTIRRLLEEHVYWVIVYSRWLDSRYWPITQEAFFGHLKQPLRGVLSLLVHRKIQRALYQQGIGRHNTAEIYQLGLDDLHALSCLLKPTAFVLGKEPTSIDACVYSFLANILEAPIPSPLQAYVKSQVLFIEYCQQMKQRFYP